MLNNALFSFTFERMLAKLSIHLLNRWRQIMQSQELPNLLWLIGDKIIRQGFNFLLTAWIARHLGVESFGVWNYAIAFVALFSFTSTLGLYNLLIRDFIKFPERVNELLGSAFVIKFLGGILTVILSYVSIRLLSQDSGVSQTLIAITALGYVAQSLDVIDFFFQSRLQARLIAYARTLSFMMFGSIKIFLIMHQGVLIQFVWVQTGELFFAGILLLISFHKYFGSILKWKADIKLVKSLIIQSLPIIFSEIAILVYMRTDQVMIGSMLGDSALGIYSAAVKLSEIWYFIPGIICSSFFPAIIKAHGENDFIYRIKLQRLYDVLIWVAILLSIFMSIFSALFINTVYGKDFANAAPILVVHIWSGVFVFIGFGGNQQLVIENLLNISFYRTLFGMVTNIILNYWLIPIFGAMGAAIATLVAQGCSAWLSNLFFAKTRGLFWMTINSLSPIRIFSIIKHNIAIQ
jgi:polysaccharide transporter, PST family